MKLEILLIALLCTVKATGKVNGDLVKVEEGGSGTDNNDTLINTIEKIDRGSKKQIDDNDSSIGSGDDDDDRPESSGQGSGEPDELSGSGDLELTDGKVVTTASPTFKISTGRKNLTSHSVIVINPGTTGAAATTEKASTAKKDTNEVTTTEINNNVEPTRGYVNPDDEDNNVIYLRSADANESSGVNFTVAIIVGVVVGAILSILIIVFLVYRLRKKDEGSYSLDEPSSATMLTAETDSPPPKGKGEYFA